MAKALIGFMGGPTLDQIRETARLRNRITDLETEVLRLKNENDGLNRALAQRVEEFTTADLFEPVAH